MPIPTKHNKKCLLADCIRENRFTTYFAVLICLDYNITAVFTNHNISPILYEGENEPDDSPRDSP